MSDQPRLPEELSQIYKSVHSEVVWLNAKWDIYIQLYQTSDERNILLNQSAYLFFRLLKHILIESIILIVSRLTDKAKTSGRYTRSLEKFINEVNSHGFDELSTSMRENLDEIHERAKPFRSWRHKKLAHSDLNTELETISNSLPGIQRREVSKMLYKINEVMNQFNLFFFNSHTAYDSFWFNNDDGDALISRLQIAQDYLTSELDNL